MRKIKQFFLLFGFLLPTTWCGAYIAQSTVGYSDIFIKESIVHGSPKGSSIQATIDGHWLSIVFLENLGDVQIEITRSGEGEIETTFTETPNGVNIYISITGSYIVTFTLPNGDEYYGEFEVTD